MTSGVFRARCSKPALEDKNTAFIQTKMDLKKKTPLINLLTDAEIVEEYYNLLQGMYSSRAKEISTDETFDGMIRAEDETKKDAFISATHILPFSQALIEYLILLEWDVRKRAPNVSQTAIYNGILRLEKALTKSSLWELVDFEDEVDGGGPITSLTDFEFNLMEQTLSSYVVDKLEKSVEPVLFFPLKHPPEPDALITWRILEKIATVNLVPSRTIYKQKLKGYLKLRLKKEVEQWLENQLKRVHIDGYREALTSVQELTKVLMEINKELASSMENIGLVNQLFSTADCNYCDVTAEVVESKLFAICIDAMNLLDAYNTAHKDFHVNMRESSMLCHVFYLQLKQIDKLLNSNTKTFVMEKLDRFYNIFSKAFLHLLHVVKVECHSRIHRAIESEITDTVIEDHGISSSTVIVLNCMSTVIDEYKQLQIEDEQMKIAFVIKITEILGDGCKIFAENMQYRADSFLENLKDSCVLRKICVLINNIQHLKEYMSELSSLMQWDNVLKSLGHDDVTGNLKHQVLRVLNLIFKSTMTYFDDVIENLLQLMTVRIRNQCDKYFNSWLKDQITLDPRLQNVERLLAVLNEQVEIVEGSLKESIFSKFLRVLWSTILNYANSEFQEGKIPDYAKTAKKNMEEIHSYFTTSNTESSQNYEVLWEDLLSRMEINSKTTVELQLDYYGQLADLLTSPDEYLGHIAFQAGYKKSGGGIIDITVKVQKAQRIPARKFHIDDLRVKVKFCPEFVFPSLKPRETKSVTEELQNPVFDETFQFSKIPVSVLQVEGAVVHVLVLNEDNSFCGEAVQRLSLIHNMDGYTSINFLPVYLMPLKRPDRNLVSFQILEKRRKRDRRARHFVSRQIASVNRQTMFFNCIPRTNSFRRLLPPRMSSYF